MPASTATPPVSSLAVSRYDQVLRVWQTRPQWPENAMITMSGESSGRCLWPRSPPAFVGTKPAKSATEGGLVVRPDAASARRSGLPALGAHAARSRQVSAANADHRQPAWLRLFP